MITNKIFVSFTILQIFQIGTLAQVNENYFVSDSLKNPPINLIHSKTDSTNNFDSHREFLPEFYKIFTDVPTNFYKFGKEAINKNSIGPILAVSLITTGLIITDQKNWENSKIIFNKNPSLKSISGITVNIGDAKWQIGLASAAALYGYIAKDNRIIKTSFESIEAVISSGLFVQLLKRISGRESPAVYTTPGGYWDLFPDLGEYQHRQPEYYAFPSGHITSLTAFLTVINNNYPEVKWLKSASIFLIGALGISLVENNMHWFSDLPLGILIGYTFGNIISGTKEENSQTETSAIPKFRFTPYVKYNCYGLECTVRF